VVALDATAQSHCAHFSHLNAMFQACLVRWVGESRESVARDAAPPTFLASILLFRASALQAHVRQRAGCLFVESTFISVLEHSYLTYITARRLQHSANNLAHCARPSSASSVSTGCLVMSDFNKQPLRPQSMADSEKTAAPSVEPSVMDPEKQVPSESLHTAEAPSVRATPEASSDHYAPAPEPKTAVEQSSQHSASEDEDNFEYPKAWRLTFITLALCLSVFCMALVRSSCTLSPGSGMASPETCQLSTLTGQHHYRDRYT
jgi:hypothetical protein